MDVLLILHLVSFVAMIVYVIGEPADEMVGVIFPIIPFIGLVAGGFAVVGIIQRIIVSRGKCTFGHKYTRTYNGRYCEEYTCDKCGNKHFIGFTF